MESMGSERHPLFDEVYKRHAVELTYGPGRTVKTVAEELGIGVATLYRWRGQYALRGGGEGSTRTIEELAADNTRLRAELLRMREREIVLKKSLGILSETPGRGMPESRP